MVVVTSPPAPEGDSPTEQGALCSDGAPAFPSFDQRPVPAADVLARFLRALGVPARMVSVSPSHSAGARADRHRYPYRAQVAAGSSPSLNSAALAWPAVRTRRMTRLAE